jgi:predicted nuclease of restriction endonuclease-like RecB superfamily
VRQLFRAARFHGLLHRVTDEGEGRYLVELDGPFSLFTSSQKYGLKLAMFLPAVLRCRRWRLRADVLWGKRKEPMEFELGPGQGLVPHDERITGVAPELARFIEGFRRLDSKWELDENDEIIATPGVAVCVPDLRFTHRETGEVVFLEAFGFWSRQAVWQRIEAAEKGFPGRLILAIGKQLRVSEEVLAEDDAAQLYVYKSSMRPKAVLERLEAG